MSKYIIKVHDRVMTLIIITIQAFRSEFAGIILDSQQRLVYFLGNVSFNSILLTKENVNNGTV